MTTAPTFQGFSPTQWVLLVFVLIASFFYFSFFRKHGSLHGAPPLDAEGLPGLGVLRFWTDRMGYMRDAAKRSSTGNWSFYVGPYPVIGLSGVSGRTAYYNSHKGAMLAEGMSALIIGAAGLPHDEKDQNVQAKKGWRPFWIARLTEIMRPERLRTYLPTFYSDCLKAYTKLGEQGTMDPMTDIYFIAWQMSMQAMGPSEIYDSPDLLRKTFYLSLDLDSILSGINVLLTWLPTPAKIRKMIAGIRLFMIFNKVIKDRCKANERGESKRKNDVVQMMMDYGDFDSTIVKQIVEAMFTAQINTAQNAAGVLCYLGSYPVWQERVYQELLTVAAQYAKDTTVPLSEQLRHVPLEVWESGMPILYACLKDSIRLLTIGTFARQNVTGQPIPLHPVNKDGLATTVEFIPPGAIIVFNSQDVNADPSIHPDPDTWNPARHLPEYEEYSKQRNMDVPYAEITWGTGKHICYGQKLAKVEVHIIVAMFVAMFEWDATDGQGKVLPTGVRTNWNTWLPTRPTEQYRLRYTKRKTEQKAA